MPRIRAPNLPEKTQLVVQKQCEGEYHDQILNEVSTRNKLFGSVFYMGILFSPDRYLCLRSFLAIQYLFMRRVAAEPSFSFSDFNR